MTFVGFFRYIVGEVDSKVLEVVWSTLEETWDLGPVVIIEVKSRRWEANRGGAKDDWNSFAVV